MVKIKTLNDRNILWDCPESGAQILSHLKLGAPCKENEGVLFLVGPCSPWQGWEEAGLETDKQNIEGL